MLNMNLAATLEHGESPSAFLSWEEEDNGREKIDRKKEGQDESGEGWKKDEY